MKNNEENEFAYEELMKLQAPTLQDWYEEYDKMQQTPLWGNGAPNFEESYGHRQPSVAVVPTSGKRKRGVVIVCAGGGFIFKSAFEGKPVAEKFARAGINAAVLDYRVNPYTQYDMLEDAKRAIRLLRCNADEWNIDPHKIAILGFSAGGQIAALAGAGFDDGDEDADDPIERVSCRPDAVISCYSSLTFCGFPGADSNLNKLAQVYTREDRVKLSAEKNLGLDAPPFFIWGTIEDEAIDSRYMLNLASELADYQIPYELHIFNKGPHGMGLCDETCPLISEPNLHAAKWADLCIEWLHEQGF